MASGLKWLKGTGALILLLALPTYSYLDFSGRDEAGEAELSFLQRATQPSGTNGSEPEFLRHHDAQLPSGNGGSTESAAAMQVILKARMGAGTATGVLPEDLRSVPVGVPSSVTSAGFVRRGQGQGFAPRPRNAVSEAAGLVSLDEAESEAVGRMVGQATRARNLENPFLAALEERESGDTPPPSDPPPTQLDEASQEQPPAPPAEEGGEAVGSGEEAAPVDDQKERREDSPEAGENPDSSQDSGTDEAPPDEPPADEGNQDSNQDPNSDPTTPPSSPYNFLIIPQPDPLDEGRRVFLARRDEADEEIFLLEDGSTFFFPQSQVLAAVGLESHHQFATSDFNFDGLLDLVRVRNESGFCALEVFLRDPQLPNGYEAIDVRLPELSVRSFGLLDFDLDNLLDLAVLFEGASHLSVFRLDMQEKALRLLEERQLPFEPAVLIDWQVIHTGGWPERILFILDESFQQAAATSSFDPGSIIQVSQIPPFRSLRVTWPTPTGPSEAEVLVFESDDRIAMLAAGRSGYRLYALFDTSFYSPMAVMGDFQGNGTRQLLVLP